MSTTSWLFLPSSSSGLSSNDEIKLLNNHLVIFIQSGHNFSAIPVSPKSPLMNTQSRCERKSSGAHCGSVQKSVTLVY
jgi:hypothetical protein